MDNMPALIVAKKESLIKDDTGIVQIIFIRDESGEIKKPDINKFPSKTVWISIGYKRIEENFKEGELFVIEQYQETDKEDDLYEVSRSDRRAEHWAKGSATKRIDQSQYIPVIYADLPDRGTGILSYKESLPQAQFFILNEESLYGPFVASSTEDEISATPSQCMPLSLNNGSIAKLPIKTLEDAQVYIPVDENFITTAAGYISSFKDIAQVISVREIEKIDYINDSQIVSFFSRNGFGTDGKNVLGRKPAEQLKEAIAQQAKRTLVTSDNERLKRLNTILDQYLNRPDPGYKIINSWLGSSDGKSFLKDFYTKNPALFESHTEDLNTHKGQLEEDIERLKLDKRKLEVELQSEKDKVHKARNEASKEIEDIKKKTAQQQQEDRIELMAELEEKIQDKEKTLHQVEEELTAVLSSLSNAIKIKDLVKEIEYTERRLEELKSAVQTQERLLKSPDLSDEAIKTQTLLDLIHGRRINHEDTPIIYSPQKHASDIPSDGNSIIQAVTEHFEDGGRSFTFEEMANLLVTVQQSFMTVLKGLPGAGKTSTAIRLAQAYHIADEYGKGDDFLNVPISRGWVSSRDFIGFYNSLKGTYQPARTGMYQFLMNGDNKEADDTLRLILLDEANLSPIEHYMSDFLGMFDPEGRSRPIDTGNQYKEQRFLNVPMNTRFIATINNDSTTEVLSPRLCDRVPIITMDYKESESTQSHAPFNLDGIISYNYLESFFGTQNANKNPELYYDLPVKLASLLPLFEDRNKDFGQVTIVSKRKRIAMQNYFSVAQQFMDETKAADFALSQYVLPLIDGFGQQYKNRLESITEYTQRNNLSRSAEILEDIISNGDVHIGSYSFF